MRKFVLSMSVVSNFITGSESPEGLLWKRLLDPILRVSDSACLRWCPRICTSNKFPGDVSTIHTSKTIGDGLLKRLFANNKQSKIEQWQW